MEKLQEILDRWGIVIDINVLLSMWEESHRGYHNLTHLKDVLDKIEETPYKEGSIEYDKLVLCALFHDCIYDPMGNDNEEKSADFFMSCVVNKSNEDILDIKKMILDTKTHESDYELSKVFNSIDMSIVEGDFEELLKWERGIYFEYSMFGDLYKTERIKFLKSLLDKYPLNTINLLKLIDWVEDNY